MSKINDLTECCKGYSGLSTGLLHQIGEKAAVAVDSLFAMEKEAVCGSQSMNLMSIIIEIPN